MATATTAGVAIGDFAGPGDAVGGVVAEGELDAVGDTSVVAEAGGAELAAAAASPGRCADETAAPFPTVKKLVASS